MCEMLQALVVCLRLCQTSATEYFAKIVDEFQPLIVFLNATLLVFDKFLMTSPDEHSFFWRGGGGGGGGG